MDDYPENPILEGMARSLDERGAGALLLDTDTNLIWVSNELKHFVEEHGSTDDLGIGRHMVENYMREPWCDMLSDEMKFETMTEHCPFFMYDTPGGKDGLKQIIVDGMKAWKERGRTPPEWASAMEGQVEEVLDAFFADMDPTPPPPLWSSTFEIEFGNLPATKITEFFIRIHDDEGRFIGTLCFYTPSLPARVLGLVARGDEGMLSRMADLFEPGRRAAAVLFADLQDSGALSRRLPSGAYFKLVRGLTSGVDDVIVRNGGIVGKHAGDGVTAFFLADDDRTSSQAARSAIEAARGIVAAVGRVAKEIAEETGLIETADCRMNVGIHWGGTLYMGQLVTGGRLEVTALGDAVTEAARIQETARDGEILVSKSLLEHLDDDDSDALQIDPDLVVYRTVSEFPHVTDKAIRDAGGLPVTVL